MQALMNSVPQGTEPYVPATPTTTNLWAWYDPKSTHSYPGTGTTLFDLQNSNDATIFGSPAYNTDYFTFDGANDYFITPNFYRGATTPHSIEVWVYPTATNACLWSQLGSETPDFGYHFASGQIYAGPISFHTIISGLWNGTAVSRAVNGAGNWLNTWNQVAFTYNGTTLTPYLNGVAGTSTNISYFAPYDQVPNSWYIAFGGRDTTAYTGTTAGWFAGRYGVIRIYTAALSNAQLLANFNATKSVYGL